MSSPSPVEPRPHSLRARLLGFLLLAIALGALAQATTAYLTALSQADLVFDRQMQKMAQALGSSVPLGNASEVAAVAADRAQEDFVVQMWTRDGQPVFQTAAHRTLRRPAGPGFSIVQTQDRTYRVYSLTTDDQIIQIAQDLEAREGMARTLALRTVGPILALAPLLMLIVWWVIRKSLAPVARVRAQMTLRKADDFSAVADDSLPDEVRPMIRDLNLLFERLGKAFEAQRSFVANAAHELRSPLAALRLQVQGLQRAQGPQAQQLATQRLTAGIDRATHLVDQLLMLARQEAGTGTEPVLLTEVDLAEVGLVSLADTIDDAQVRQIDLGVHVSEPCVVCAQAEPLRILIRNLLDNAIKYTPPGGVVDLSFINPPGGPCVVVEDSGPGISAEDLPHVLNRFYRTSGAKVEGSGLGLAIVKAIADRQGGHVELDRSPRLGGLRVTLRMSPSE